MKTYYNPTTQEWYYSSESMTRTLDNGDLFSGFPSEEQLTEWGFEEYHEPEPTPEEQLEQAKREKQAELIAYDSSDEVNSFSLNGNDMWIFPTDRSNYMLTLEGAKRLGVPTVTFLGQTIAVDDAIAMLDAINLYAMQCVAVTDSHEAAIKALQSIHDVDAYDFTVGYPTKISF